MAGMYPRPVVRRKLANSGVLGGYNFWMYGDIPPARGALETVAFRANSLKKRRTSGGQCMLARVAVLAVYASSCALLHSLLRKTYVEQCTGTWLSSLLGVEASPFCGVLRNGLTALQWTPLPAAALLGK